MSRAAKLALVIALACPYVLLLVLWWRVEDLRKNMVSGRISDKEQHILWARMTMRDRADRAFATVSGLPLAKAQEMSQSGRRGEEESPSVVRMREEWGYGTQRPLSKEQVSDLKSRLEAAVSPQLCFDARFRSSSDEEGNEIWESWCPWTGSPHWHVTSKVSVNSSEKGTACRLFVHAWFQ